MIPNDLQVFNQEAILAGEGDQASGARQPRRMQKVQRGAPPSPIEGVALLTAKSTDFKAEDFS